MLQVSGDITYNGETFASFVPQRTAAYVDQTDVHTPDLTVRETLDFAARCQGVTLKKGQPFPASRPTCHVIAKACVLVQSCWNVFQHCAGLRVRHMLWTKLSTTWIKSKFLASLHSVPSKGMQTQATSSGQAHPQYVSRVLVLSSQASTCKGYCWKGMTRLHLQF